MDVVEGECFNDGRFLEALVTGTIADDHVVTDVAAVPCTEPHDFEVYLVRTLEDGHDAPFPGLEVLDRRVGHEMCIPEFDAFVGTAFDDSSLNVSWFYPTAAVWDTGDRQVSCAVFAMDGIQLTGTSKGSQR